MFTRITAYCDTKLLSTHLPHKYAKPPLDQVAYLSGRLLYLMSSYQARLFFPGYSTQTHVRGNVRFLHGYLFQSRRCFFAFPSSGYLTFMKCSINFCETEANASLKFSGFRQCSICFNIASVKRLLN